MIKGKFKHFVCILLFATMSLMAVSQWFLWDEVTNLWENEKEVQLTLSGLYEVESMTSSILAKNKESDNKDREFTIQQIFSIKHVLAQMNRDCNEIHSEILEMEKELIHLKTSGSVLVATHANLWVKYLSLRHAVKKIGRELKGKENLIRDVVDKNLPSVVHIACYNDGEASGEASGVIISEDGIILTAAHVVTRPGYSYVVTLNDKRQYITTKVCILKGYDVGFLKIEETGLPISTFGSFEDVKVGDPLFVIGSPFGYDHFNSVSKGVLSAKNRSYFDIPGWTEVFQMDVPINPGNSGCPVYNSSGGIVGISVGGISYSGDFSGVEYGIPSSVWIEYLGSVYKALTIGEEIEIPSLYITQ